MDTPQAPSDDLGARPRSAWQLLKNGQFSWLVVGNVSMFFGFGASILLRSLLAWHLTGDEMSLAYINLVAGGCMLATSFISGAVIDRFDRRLILLISQVMIVVVESIVLVMLITGHLSFGVLLASALVASASFPFIMPSRTAMMVHTVGRSAVGKATALMSGSGNLARMVSPALVGFLAEFGGMSAAYGLLVFIHVTSLVSSIPLRRNPPPDMKGQAFIRDIADGFIYIGRNRPLLAAVLFGLAPIMIVVPLQNLLVIFVEQVWNRGGDGLGIMMAAIGIGGLMGSILMSHLSEGSLLKPLTLATVIMGVVLLIFSHTPSFIAATVFLIVIFCASVLAQSMLYTAVQLMTEERMRGRITTMMLMSISVAPVGTLPLALATKHIGAPWAMTIAAIALLVVVALVWFFAPSFRAIDDAAGVRD